MLYTSSALSLACLEVLVHVREARLPVDYAWVAIDVPDVLIDGSPSVAPSLDNEQRCAEFGSDWLATGAKPALVVPSVIIPTERNVLLSPRQDRFAEIRFSKPQPFRFDPRLLKVGPVPM